MSWPTAPAPTARRLLAVAALTCWALLLVPGGLAPAGAAAQVGLVEPAAGTRLEGPFDVVVRVRPDEGEVIQQVQATLTGPSERIVELAPDAEPEADGSQVWRAAVDPSAEGALANGAYQVAVQAVPLLGEPRAADPIDVRLLVAPPRRDLTAAPGAADPTAVELSWDPVEVPDLLGYRIERRPDDVDGSWAVVHELPDPRADRVVDAVEVPGPYRYRLLVVRSDGDGGELVATSHPRGVRADPADPGVFPVAPEPDPRPTGSPSEVPQPAPTPTPDPAGTEPAPTPPRPSVPVTVRPPAPAPAPVPAPPLTPPPAVVPFDNGVFEDLLPFEVTESERIVVDTDTAILEGDVREGGTLAVLTEEPLDRGVASAAATGLLLVVVGAHVRRFLAVGGGRSRG